MASVLPPMHRSRFLVSASALPAAPSAPPAVPAQNTSRRKRFSPISVTHTAILGAAHSARVVSLGTTDLAAVLRKPWAPLDLARPADPEPAEPEPAKDTRERPRYRVPTSPARTTRPAPRPAPVSLVRPRAQFPLYLPILDSRVPPVVLPSLDSIHAAAQHCLVPSLEDQGRRSARARRPASRTLEYTSDPLPPRKRRADVSTDKRQLRTSKRARKDVNYVIPTLASIDREMADHKHRTPRRRSDTEASFDFPPHPTPVPPADVEMTLDQDSPSAEDEAKRRARGKQPN
ncbi:hypothetical protein CTheo_3221 [Ceratobasidium theobromae]|uniref:Uncharacterized protein n=1 Tax=Ceratobasidium theobromae TaxID=1582974 RepID=A0A5N5QP13_9AGAM|nr:hypothetical protein CTheo_3221 [Ceratobasidium theobromae]